MIHSYTPIQHSNPQVATLVRTSHPNGHSFSWLTIGNRTYRARMRALGVLEINRGGWRERYVADPTSANTYTFAGRA